MKEGLFVGERLQRLKVARHTASHWRHRFLALPHHVKTACTDQIVQALDTVHLAAVLQPFCSATGGRCRVA